LDTVLVAQTRNAELHALGTGGQLAVLAWDQVTQYLRRVLSAAHARLFAEPNFDPERGTIDWYTEGVEPPVPLAQLDPATRAEVEANLGRLVGEIQAQAEALRRSQRESDRFMGEMLGLALEVPDENRVYAAGTQPILAGWGHLREGPGAERGQLMRFVRAPVAPMAILASAPAAPPRGPAGWLWPLVALLLLLLLLAGLLWWYRPLLLAWLEPSGPACRLSERDIALMTRLDEERARETGLREELANIMGDVGRKRVACPAPPAPPAPPPQRAEAPPRPAPPPPQPPPADDQQRVKERGGQQGKLQVTLAWDDRNDLDLYVVCPNGEEINWRAANRQRCGGKLDIDANNGREPLTDRPVENVFWDDPQPGRYKILVQNYKRNGAPQSPYRITIRQEGKPDRVIRGIARAGEPPRPVEEIEVAGR
jgi:hypothetical protein